MWLRAAGAAAYIDEGIYLAYVSSKKWTSVRAAPFLVGLADLTAFSVLVRNQMALRNVRNVLGLANLVFDGGAEVAASL